MAQLVSDRFTLGTKRVLHGGTTVYPVTFASPGVLERNGRREKVTREVLADAAYNEAMAGVPVILDDGPAHGRAVNIRSADRRHLTGYVLRSEWSDAAGAQVGEIVIGDARGVDLIEKLGVRGGSVAYHVEYGAPEDGASDHDVVQVRRYDPVNFALTRTPRDRTARVVADANRRSRAMKLKPAIAAILAEWGIVADAETGYPPEVLDLAGALADERAARVASDSATAEAVARADKAEAIKPPTAGDWRPVLEAAARRKVEIAADANLDDARRAVVRAFAPEPTKAKIDTLPADALDVLIAADAAGAASAQTASGVTAGSRQVEAKPVVADANRVTRSSLANIPLREV